MNKSTERDERRYATWLVIVAVNALAVGTFIGCWFPLHVTKPESAERKPEVAPVIFNYREDDHEFLSRRELAHKLAQTERELEDCRRTKCPCCEPIHRETSRSER